MNQLKKRSKKSFPFLLSIPFGLLALVGYVNASTQPYITDHKINFGVGNKYEQVTDVRITGSGQTLSFTRTYNSQSNTTTPLGYGWIGTFNESLTIAADQITLTQAGGRAVHFTDDGTGKWINQTGSKRVITSITDGYQLTEKSRSFKQFNSSGKITRKSDKNGNTLTYTYTGNDIAIANDTGQELSFEFDDTLGNLTSVTGPTGTYTYTYDTNNNLKTVTKPDTGVVEYVYDDPNDVHNMTGIIDEESVRVLTVEYDSEDRAVKSSKADGEDEVTIDYSSSLTRLITDTYGTATTYNLTVQQGIVKVQSFTGPGCSSCGDSSNSSYEYNTRLQVLNKTDGKDVSTVYTYDDAGNKLTTTEASGTSLERTTTKTYTEDSRVETISKPSIASPGNQVVTSMTYDTNGNMLTRTINGFNSAGAKSATTTYTYNSRGQVLTIDGPRTDVNDSQALVYYPDSEDQGNNRGQLHTITNALNQAITFSNYNIYGQAETITDANSQITTRNYNVSGFLTSTTQNGHATSLSYDKTGKLLTQSLPGSRSLTYTNTPSGQTESITDSSGNYIFYDYDTKGRRTSQKIYDPAATLTTSLSYEYDTYGRLLKAISPDNSFETYGYDAINNLVSKLDQLSNETTYNYDELKRLTTITEPGEIISTFLYDTQDNQTHVTDANNNATVFTYDDFGNILTRTSPDSGVTNYTYDLAGNVLSKTDANTIQTSYTYDALNRLTAITYPDSVQNISYTYDQNTNGVGRLSSVTDATGSTSYSYNQFGNMIAENKFINNQNFSLAYGYNENNELTSITYPSGRVISYVRDVNGNVTSVTTTVDGVVVNLAENMTYLPFGPRTSMGLGNGLSVTNSFDQLYRLTGTQAGTIYDRSFGYLTTGHVQTIIDNISSTRNQSFGYDALGRLTSGTGIYGALSFTYDNIGNRLTQTADGVDTSYNYITGTNKLDQVTATETTNYLYDDAGNTLSKGEQQFGWSQNNQLLTISSNAETLGEYGYDARSLRTVRTTGDETILSVYDLSGNLIAETDEAGNTLREFTYLDGARLSLFEYTGLPTEFVVTVSTSSGTLLENVKAYAFDENNRYAGISGTTDVDGKAIFDRELFGGGNYTFRIDYLSNKFWTEAVAVQTSGGLHLIIEEEAAEVTVIMDGDPKENVKVYVFNESGSYLGLSGVTDENGEVSFNLPEDQNYKFRADLFGNQYWSDTTTITNGGTGVMVNSLGGTLTLTIQEEADTPLSGIKIYLFSESGSYLGLSATSTASGEVSYKVPAGTYKIRADYFGYKFWSDLIVLSTTSTQTSLDIAHQDVTITVQADEASVTAPISGSKAYLFTPAGSYLGLSGTTNEDGQISFHLPEQSYKVRADYLGQQFWSADFTWQDNAIAVPHGTTEITVTKMELPLPDVKVYVFSQSGSYLGINNTTDANGIVSFTLPNGEYRFRADYQGKQFWGEDLNLIAHQINPVTISTGGGSFVLSLADQESNPLENVRCYLFTEAGSYLGDYGNSDSNGQTGFSMADGSYKVRVDYMGVKYWTDVFTVPASATMQYVINHQDVNITSLLQYGADQVPIEDANVYLFNSSGTYMGINSKTDSNGVTSFYLPAQDFKVRVDYFGKQYWSEVFNHTDTSVIVAEGIAEINLSSSSSPLDGVSVYVFGESDNYLGLTAKTDENGKVSFQIPAGLYKFRADYQASKFWATEEVVADIITPINLQTGGGTLAATVRTDDSTILAGAPCYLFSSTGTYLGQTAATDDAGMVSFDVANGSYKIRVDYLGYQYWSDIVTAPEVLSTSILISHYDVAVTVNADDGTTTTPLPGVRSYLFTESGSYTGIYTDSDESGQAHFSVPLNSYKVRADYKGVQYWTESFNAADSVIDIGHGEIDLTVTENGSIVIGAKVYLFTETGSYLNINGTTDEYGKVNFNVPTASYKLRVDYNSTQYWTDAINILAYQVNQIPFAINDIAASTTNNPSPERFDGKGPVYMPMVAASGDSLSGLGETTAPGLSTEPRTYYYLSDHLGTSQLIVDDATQVVWQGDYSPFGEVDVVIDKINNNFRFPGQILDPESGLYYNWHRFYDPQTGRYISADPIGLAGGMNLYAYVGGNPINWIDPKGLVTCVNVKYYYVTKCIENLGKELDDCECHIGSWTCKEESRADFKSCLKEAHKQCNEDLNKDGKVDKWDEAMWAFGRFLGPLGGVPPRNYGDEGPGSVHPSLLPNKSPEI